MWSKIFAVMNGAFALFLLFCSIHGTKNEGIYYDAGALACGVLAIGCRQRKRWIVAIGPVPIILAALACAVTVNGMTGFFSSKEAGMIDNLALAAIAVAVGSMVVAGKPADPESSSAST